MYDTIFAGIAGGVSYALTGYGKNVGQTFDWNKFISTALLGAIAGCGMVFFDMPVDMSYPYFISMGFVPIVENLFKTIKRRMFKQI